MQELQIGPGEAGQRMDKYLKKALPNAPMSLLYKQLRNKNITLNKKKAEGREMLKSGDVIQCFFSQETFELFSASPADESISNEYESAYQKLRGISVLYEDEHFIFLNKPAGILSQKAKPDDLSVNEWMIGRLLHDGSVSESTLRLTKPSVANRLDRNTSGIVLCGKSLMGLQALSYLLREHKTEKHYRAICHGILTKEELITGYLIKDESANQVRIYSEPRKDADFIKTRYTPLQIGQAHTLLDVELITGKTHQIRAHLSSIGHSLVGDFKYAPEALLKLDRSSLSASHQLLHADHVIFPEWESIADEAKSCEDALKPLSGKVFAAPLPADFAKIVRKLFSASNNINKE